MSKKHKKVWRVLHYVEQLLILISTVTGCVSISHFAPLVGIPIEMMSSAVGLKICVITVGIKKYNSLIEKKKKKYDKIVLLNWTVLIYKALIYSNISHDELVLINDALKEFYDMKEEIKNSNDKQRFKLYIKQCHLIVWTAEKIQKVKTQKL